MTQVADKKTIVEAGKTDFPSPYVTLTFLVPGSKDLDFAKNWIKEQTGQQFIKEGSASQTDKGVQLVVKTHDPEMLRIIAYAQLGLILEPNTKGGYGSIGAIGEAADYSTIYEAVIGAATGVLHVAESAIEPYVEEAIKTAFDSLNAKYQVTKEFGYILPSKTDDVTEHKSKKRRAELNAANFGVKASDFARTGKQKNKAIRQLDLDVANDEEDAWGHNIDGKKTKKTESYRPLDCMLVERAVKNAVEAFLASGGVVTESGATQTCAQPLARTALKLDAVACPKCNHYLVKEMLEAGCFGSLTEVDAENAGAADQGGARDNNAGGNTISRGGAPAQSQSGDAQPAKQPTEKDQNANANTEVGGTQGGILCPACGTEVPRYTLKVAVAQFLSQIAADLAQGNQGDDQEQQQGEQEQDQETPEQEQAVADQQQQTAPAPNQKEQGVPQESRVELATTFKTKDALYEKGSIGTLVMQGLQESIVNLGGAIISIPNKDLLFLESKADIDSCLKEMEAGVSAAEVARKRLGYRTQYRKVNESIQTMPKAEWITAYFNDEDSFEKARTNVVFESESNNLTTITSAVKRAISVNSKIPTQLEHYANRLRKLGGYVLATNHPLTDDRDNSIEEKYATENASDVVIESFTDADNALNTAARLLETASNSTMDRIVKLTAGLPKAASATSAKQVIEKAQVAIKEASTALNTAYGDFMAEKTALKTGEKKETTSNFGCASAVAPESVKQASLESVQTIRRVMKSPHVAHAFSMLDEMNRTVTHEQMAQIVRIAGETSDVRVINEAIQVMQATGPELVAVRWNGEKRLTNEGVWNGMNLRTASSRAMFEHVKKTQIALLEVVQNIVYLRNVFAADVSFAEKLDGHIKDFSAKM